MGASATSPRGLARIENPDSPVGAPGVTRDALHHGERRRLAGQAGQELVDGAFLALDLEQHARGVVEHEAGEAALVGQPVDVGPKPDPLDGSVDTDSSPDPPRGGGAHPTSSRSTW